MDPIIANLIYKINKRLPYGYKELEKYEKKITHWAWWAWPNNKPGHHEPGVKTYVTQQTAFMFLNNIPDIWYLTLHKINHLLDYAAQGFPDIYINDYQKEIIPMIDHGRICYFLGFWNEILKSNETWQFLEFRIVIKNLSKHFKSIKPNTLDKTC